MPRVFVAVWPDADVARSLSQVLIPADEGVRPVAPANWHITLRFFGDLSNEELTGVVDALDRSPLRCAHVELGPRPERLDSRQIVIPAAGVDDLAHDVRQVTAAFGRPDERPFRGHLTIARVRRGAVPGIEPTAFRAEQVVDEISVVTSDLQPTGAVYTTVHRRRLDPDRT